MERHIIDFQDNIDELEFCSRDEIRSQLKIVFGEHIHCEKCGKCCRIPYPYISKSEIKNISKYLEISTKKFRRKYTIKREYDHRYLKLPCPFLKNNLCSIYSMRPMMCKDFPLRFSLKSGVVALSGISLCPTSKRIYKEIYDFYIKFDYIIGMPIRNEDLFIDFRKLKESDGVSCLISVKILLLFYYYKNKRLSCTDEEFSRFIIIFNEMQNGIDYMTKGLSSKERLEYIKSYIGYKK